MFSFFFGSNKQNREWFLRPRKYSRDSPHHFSNRATLPYSILQELTMDNYQPPYVFEISHEDGALRTSCGVLDFALDCNEIHIPAWLYEQLALDTVDEIVLSYVKLEKGTGIKLLPHSVEFLEVENPKYELENGLRDYPVLSYGDEIVLPFEDIGICRFTITQIYPETLESIYLVDTDLNVDFEEPLGYQEKIEAEKTVMKYVSVGPAEKAKSKIVRMERLGLVTKWDEIH
ncbi:ubiquitin fusion degradation protein 1 [Enteropsectra breve]|nr:ubiquitin fusion degradation protein 1 [Enteropsectra breve]